MNRKTRRTVASLARRRKWDLLGQHLTLDQVRAAREHVEKLGDKRWLIGHSVAALRHEEHRRGNVLLRELNS